MTNAVDKALDHVELMGLKPVGLRLPARVVKSLGDENDMVSPVYRGFEPLLALRRGDEVTYEGLRVVLAEGNEIVVVCE